MSDKKYMVAQKIRITKEGNPIYVPTYRTDSDEEAVNIANTDPLNSRVTNVCGDKDFCLENNYWKSFDL